jgi:hypothetical protein
VFNSLIGKAKEYTEKNYGFILPSGSLTGLESVEKYIRRMCGVNTERSGTMINSYNSLLHKMIVDNNRSYAISIPDSLGPILGIAILMGILMLPLVMSGR